MMNFKSTIQPFENAKIQSATDCSQLKMYAAKNALDFAQVLGAVLEDAGRKKKDKT